MRGVAPASYFAQVTTCRDGTIIQQADFDRLTYHAGGTSSEVFSDLAPGVAINEFAVGIENSNYGWLLKHAGRFFIPRKVFESNNRHRWEPGRQYPKRLPAPIRAPDHRGEARWWEPYTDEIVDANIEVLSAIVERFDIAREDVVEHSTVSPDRKWDPGPLFPAAEILDAVYTTAELGELEDRRK
jgi:N-acetyl-anhydromuramyl-L-alanine amidase AmpD